MPTFGEFDTVGEPLSVTDERGHVSTVWQARKTGTADNRLYIVKCYCPRRRAPQTGQPEEGLDRDRGLEFLEGIKQIKKALNEGGPCLAPIHALGTSDLGAWYVTDYYPRNNLKAWIGRRGGVDSAALRQIVHSIVEGCLALKRSRGHPHGNLKPANVFLVGQPRPLRKTPFVLTDAYPASPLQLAGLDDANRHEVDELLQQVIEVQDLRALGEIILQLVEGRLFSRNDDFNYPVERSSAWSALGKEGEQWRQRCNQLLNPQLSLETINLERLEVETRPPPLWKDTKVIVSVAVGVVLVSSVTYFTVSSISKSRLRQRQEKFGTAFEAAQQALSTTNVVVALERVSEALTWMPGDANALKLKTQIEDLANQQFTSAANAAQAAFQQGNYTNAMVAAEMALAIRPDDAAFKKLKADAEARYRESIAAAGREQDYRAATNAAALAYRQGNYTTAMSEAEKALAIHSDDSAMKQTRADAQKQWDDANAAASREKGFVSASNAAWTAFQQGNYTNAMAEADRALGLHPDVTLTRLRDDAHSRWNQTLTATTREQEYRSATNAAWQAYREGNYTNAMAAANKALVIHSGDAAIQKLLDQVRKEYNETLKAAGREQAFVVATNTARIAFQQGNDTNALAQLEIALGIHPDDPALKQLKAESQKRLTAIQAAASQDEAYRSLTNSAQSAYRQGGYADALTLVEKALVIHPNDSAVKQFKLDVQARLNEAATAKLRQDLAGALLLANQSLAATNQTLAATNFQKALGMAAELKDDDRQKAAGDGVALTTALLQADAARKSGPKAIDDELKHLTDAQKFAGAPRWVNAWFLDATQRKNQTATPPPVAARPPRPALISIADLDFVWVNGLGANKQGAYVAANELSWKQYNAIRKLLNQPPQNPTEDAANPAWIKFSDAGSLLSQMNESKVGLAELKLAAGKWRLLGPDEYLVLAPVKEDPTKDRIIELQAKGENLAKGIEALPNTITQDPRDANSLRDVIGNMREWTSDGRQFGISYNDDGITAASRKLFKTSTVGGYHVGLRLVADESK